MRYRHKSFSGQRPLDTRKLPPKFGVYVLWSDGQSLLVAKARTRDDATALSRQVLINPAQGIVDVYIEELAPQRTAAEKRPQARPRRPRRNRRRVELFRTLIQRSESGIEFASFGPKDEKPCVDDPM